MATPNDALVNGFLQRAATGNLQPIDTERATAGITEARYAPVGAGEIFKAGVASGGEGMINDFEYFKALGNTLLGNEQAAADNIKSARIKAEFAANPLYGMETFEEFTNAPTVGGFLDQVILSVGQITPSIASSIASGFTGVLAATAGKAALGAAGKATAKKLTQDAIEKKGRGEALDEAEEAYLNASYDLFTKETAKYGGIAGLVAGELPLMQGGAFAEFDDAGVEMTPDRALQSLLIGGAQTAVSVGGEVFVLGRLANLAKSKGITTDSFLTGVAKGTAKGLGTSGAVEGATETVQEGISVVQRTAVDDAYTAEQAQLRLGQAFFTGFFGGGAPGAVGGAVAGGVSAANSQRVFDKARGMIEDKLQGEVSGDIDGQRLGLDPNGPAPESLSDINAQVAAVADPNSAKQAAWVPANRGLSLATEAEPNEVFEIEHRGKTLYGAVIPNQGTIVSAERSITEEVVRSGADEESLRIALGYSATKAGDQVVRVKDIEGNVVSEQATDEEGLQAAIQAAEAIAGNTRTVDVVSTVQALEERRQRNVRAMRGNEQVDDIDLVEQEESFTTEAQERELSEGFNELDETPTEDVADFALGNPDSRSDPATFESNWANILGLVPPEERANVAALENVASEGFARTFLSYLRNDPGYYSVEQRSGRLYITRAPDSADSFLSGATKDEAAQQRAASRIQQLISRIKNITALTSNQNYFLRGEKGLRRNPTKAEPAKKGEQFKAKLDIETFTAEGPDGESTPIRINDVIAAGRDLNVGAQDALVGENLSPAQSTKAALLRGLAVMREQGYKVSFMGKPLNFSDNNQLGDMSAQLDLNNPNWARDLTLNGQRLFSDLIIFQSGGQQFSLRDLLQTADPIPQESLEADRRTEQQPRIARERAERRIEEQIRDYILRKQEEYRQAVLLYGYADYRSYADLEKEARELANDPEADRLNVYIEQELEKLRDAEVGFTPSEIDLEAQTESVVGFKGQSQSLTPAADALKRVAQWRQDELQRQREAMNAGTRSVVRPAELDAEIDAQLPAKQQEFLAEAEAQVAQTPAGINPATGRPFTASGTTIGGSIELKDEIEQAQIQAATEAGVFQADRADDPDPNRASAARRRRAKLDEIQRERDLTAAQRGLQSDIALDPTSNPMTAEEADKERAKANRRPDKAVEPAIHPSRLVIEDAPAEGGFNQTQATARGYDPNRVIDPRRQENLKWREDNKIRPSEVEQLTRVIGDIGSPASMILNKALQVFRQQIRKPITVYTRSEWVAQNTAKIREQFNNGNINLAQMNERLAELQDDADNYGSVIDYQNKYVIILQDSFADGDVDGVAERMAAVLGHELGHIVFDQEIKRLADEGGPLFDMLMKAFQEDAANNDVQQYQGKNGFEEWYADQVASYLYDSQKKAIDGKSSYFKRIAAKFREFFEAVNEFLDGRLTANADFRRYVRDVVKANKDNKDLYSNLTGESHLDAVDKAVIRNWNGKISEQVPDKAIEAAQRMSKRMLTSGSYGFLKKYLTASDNWLRGLGPAGVELGQFFYGKSQSAEASGFHHDKQRVENKFVQKLAAAMGVNPNRVMDWDTPELNEVLQQAEDETIDTADLTDPRAKAVRAVFEEFHATYLQDEQGRPYFQVRRRKNYAPRLINFHGLEESAEMREQLAQLLVKYPNTSKGDQFGNFDVTIEEARKIVKQILADPSENPDVAQNSQELPNQDQEDAGHIRPGFRNALARSLGAIPTTELRGIGALAPPVLAFTQYFHHATRRVEFEKRGGEDRIKLLLNQIPEDQREYAKQAIMAQLGRVGIGMKPWVRTLNSVDAVWTSTTTLLFTAFTSFTDLAGPIIRSKDFAGMSRAFAEIQRTLTTDENQALTRAVGSAAAEAASNIFMAAGELDYANSTARRVLDHFFRYTGLQWYTRFSREFAAGMGREFLLDIANRDQNDTTQRWLDELGITQEQILAWDSGDGSFDTPEGQAVAKAIARFVDESIVRPNAAERPVWASHPIAMVVWRLKSYFYSFGKTVLGGMGREFQNRYREDGDFRGGGMVLALAMGTMLPLAAFGMEMKELTKWMLQALVPGIEATGRTFRSDHMSSPEYLATLVEKSGALGPWSIPLSIIQSAQWGDNPIVSQVPIVDLADATLLEGNWNRPIPVLNNID